MDRTSRRTHLKSRSGCAECKRRRIKCDEVRPACGHCVKSGKACPYRSPHNAPPGAPSRSGSATPDAAAAAGPVPSEAAETPASMAADMVQLRLLQHFLSEESFRPLLSPRAALTASQLVAMAVDCEYLMTEILAVPAMHLAHAHTEQRPTHRAHSRRLHARAVTLFAAVQAEARNTRLLAVVFFSWLVGVRLLGELTLEEMEPGHVLPRFLVLVGVLRGVRSMAKTAWSGLEHGEDREMLGVFVEQGLAISSMKGKGDHTALVRLLIKDSLGLSDEVRAGCLEALNLIQAAIDVKLDEHAAQDANHLCMLLSFSWPQIVSQDFLHAAGLGRPEALLVLAFFAVLLHWCEHTWVFGDTGRCLLDSIGIRIGPGWERWLHWPQSVVGAASPSLGSGSVVETSSPTERLCP